MAANSDEDGRHGRGPATWTAGVGEDWRCGRPAREMRERDEAVQPHRALMACSWFDGEQLVDPVTTHLTTREACRMIKVDRTGRARPAKCSADAPF